MEEPTLQSRIETSFLCLAVTDALGAPLEFQPRRKDPADYVTTMLPNKNFGLAAGHFTDDTSMALCLAGSLVDSKGTTSYRSQAEAYVSWFLEGRMSSVPGRCFDIGMQTREALKVWNKALQEISRAERQVMNDNDNENSNGSQSTGAAATTSGSEMESAAISKTLSEIKQRCSEENNCGNGSLMRVLPTILVSSSEEQAIRLARESSLVTHPHGRCVDSCHLYAIMVYHALRGASKADIFQSLRTFFSSSSVSSPSSSSSLPSQTTSSTATPWKIDEMLIERFSKYTTPSDFHKTPESQIKSSGYVLDTLEAALWAFFTTDTYRDGAIRVVNLGDDADTVGAVYGGLAGAFYGRVECIPLEWRGVMVGKGLDTVVAGVVARVLKFVS